jgi:hypothetical protein
MLTFEIGGGSAYQTACIHNNGVKKLQGSAATNKSSFVRLRHQYFSAAEGATVYNSDYLNEFRGRGATVLLHNAIGSVLLLALALLSIACRSSQSRPKDSISFSMVPVAGRGGPDALDAIQGSVLRSGPDQRIVLYAHSGGVWWLQPTISHPFTEIKPNLTWQNFVHLGDRYAALLVSTSFNPGSRLQDLPAKGGTVLGIATVSGTPPHPRTIHFSGYDWEARQKYGDRGGKLNRYDSDNAWVDQEGLLHLRIEKREDQWVGAEVSLNQSLGHGLYQFTVRDVSHLDPAAVLTMYTWGPADRFNREADVEVSHRGDPDVKRHNAQFVVQPYYEPANTSHFDAPAGLMTFSFHWGPGEMLFTANRGLPSPASRPLASHRFDSGVPNPGGESIHIDLYAFGKGQLSMRESSELIFERFIYSP